MILLVLGVAIWVGAHLFKRLAPEARARMGDKAKGPISIALFVSLALMVVGYRMAEPTYLFAPPAWTIHLNNTLMVIAVVMIGMGHSKGRMRSWLRHPMLTGALLWGVSHLLVNGDVPSLVLFGGIALWAIAEMVLINRAEGPWVRPEPGPVSGDIRLIVISLVVFAVIAFIHQLVGPWPFPS